MKKSVSVIIPCYNAERYIDRCLQSITDQTYPLDSIEIICVNDASTDSTLDVLKSWEERYPDNIVVVDCEVNGRQGRARNIGLSYATGEWIAFVDADDWIEPDYLKLMYDQATPDCDLVICKPGRDSSANLTYYANEQKNSAGDTSVHTGTKILELDSDEKRRECLVLATLTYSAYCKLIRKTLLIENSILFPEYLAYEDIYWGSLLPYYVNKAAILDSVLYHYYVNPDSTVLANDADYHTDMLTVNLMAYVECVGRGLYEKYNDEIEYNFLYTCYLAFLKVLARRFSEPRYSLFRLLQEITREKAYNWRTNWYIANGDIKELHRMLLELIDKDVNREEFAQVLKIIRKAGM